MCAREERPRSPRTRSPCNGFTTLLLIALVPTPPSCEARSPDVSDSTWCQAVPAEAKVCRAPGRRDMRFPNLLAERRESHVSARALRWAPLLSSSCHPDVRLFLCAVLAPQCLDRFVQPCRSLCEVVRDACTISNSCSAVPEFGVWPSEIKCEAFPPGPEGCISETVNSISRRKDVVMHNCHNCRARQASSIGALMQTFCGHDIVLPVRLIRLTPAVPRVIIAETHHTSMRPAISAWVRQHAPCAARLARPYPGSQFVILGRLTKEGHLDVQSVYAWEAEDKVVALGLALWPWHKRSC